MLAGSLDLNLGSRGHRMVDGIGAIALKYKDNPETAVRSFDEGRAGVVIGDGGGVLMLESLE